MMFSLRMDFTSSTPATLGATRADSAALVCSPPGENLPCFCRWWTCCLSALDILDALGCTCLSCLINFSQKILVLIPFDLGGRNPSGILTSIKADLHLPSIIVLRIRSNCRGTNWPSKLVQNIIKFHSNAIGLTIGGINCCCSDKQRFSRDKQGPWKGNKTLQDRCVDLMVNRLWSLASVAKI